MNQDLEQLHEELELELELEEPGDNPVAGEQEGEQERDEQEEPRNDGAFLLLCYKQLISKGARLRIAWVMRGSLPVQMHAVCCTVARGLLAPLFHTHPCAPHNLQRTCR